MKQNSMLLFTLKKRKNVCYSTYALPNSGSIHKKWTTLASVEVEGSNIPCETDLGKRLLTCIFYYLLNWELVSEKKIIKI